MRSRRLPLCLALTTSALLVGVAVTAPGAALASNAEAAPYEVCDKYQKCSTSYYIAVRAGPGETNQFVVGKGGVVSDLGAAISAGDRCQQVSANSVRCSLTDIRVAAGDGNDRVQVNGAAGPISLEGEAGDDRLDLSGAPKNAAAAGGGGDDVLLASRAGKNFLSGDEGRDELNGGPRSSTLAGGEGEDRIVGGGGEDSVSVADEAAPAADLIDGGAGRDKLEDARLDPVRALDIDLARVTPNGAGGEKDTVRNVEDIVGGDEVDRLAGTDGPNKLVGLYLVDDADDTLLGRGGNDHLSRGGLLAGGPGDDYLDDGRRNRCGPGRDTVAPIQRAGGSPSIIGADCERMVGLLLEERARLLFRRRSLRSPLLRLRGRFQAIIDGDRARYRAALVIKAARSAKGLKRAAPIVARAATRRRARQTFTLRPRLTRRGRRLVRGGRRWLRVYGYRGDDGGERSSFIVRLR